MKQFLLSVLFILNLTTVLGQSSDEKMYVNARSIFSSKEYTKSNYPRFNKLKIKQINNNTYQFGDRTLSISIDNERNKTWFRNGIFNPDIVFGNIFNLTTNDSLSICCLEELEPLNPNPQTKRFKFWLFRVGLLNPLEYYVEFTNEKANRNTSLRAFVKNARMTFFYKGTLII